ncbi:MAG: hypothetical protein K0S26_2333 [Bacteroidota bacterium]|jgi:hypothetical protein|nr:hypothetical protein [Bacteroidota bacterium]
MKYTAFLKIIFLFICFSSYSQTITVAINDKVLASKDTAVLDINADSNIDIKILRYTGIDNIMYSATSKQANIKLGDLAKQSGQTFSNYGNQCSLPSSVFGCYWIPAWQLNTGQRYMGYYRLNAPGDTTFGYINLNFVGDNQSGCFDTLYVYSNTYSTVSNAHLLAGQSTSTLCSTPITYSIQITAPTCSSCCDGSAQIVNLTGGCNTPYSVTWIPAGGSNMVVNNLCPGNYSVTVKDSQGGSCCPDVTQGCFVPSSPCITFSIQTTTETCPGCCDGTAQVTNLIGGCAPYSIAWSTAPTQFGSSAIGMCSGSYSVTIQDIGCCPSVTQGCFVPLGGTTSISDNYLGASISIFPNPITNSFVISTLIENAQLKVEITDICGKLISSEIKSVGNYSAAFDTDLYNGVYFLNITDLGTGHKAVKKLIVQR